MLARSDWLFTVGCLLMEDGKTTELDLGGTRKNLEEIRLSQVNCNDTPCEPRYHLHVNQLFLVLNSHDYNNIQYILVIFLAHREISLVQNTISQRCSSFDNATVFALFMKNSWMIYLHLTLRIQLVQKKVLLYPHNFNHIPLLEFKIFAGNSVDYLFHFSEFSYLFSHFLCTF